MRYYAVYVERFCGKPEDPEWHPAECLLGAEMTLEDLKKEFPMAQFGTSIDDFVYVLDETDPNNPIGVPAERYR